MTGRRQAPRWVHDATFRPPRGSRGDLAQRIAEMHDREPGNFHFILARASSRKLQVEYRAKLREEQKTAPKKET